MTASAHPRLDVRRGGWALPAEPPETWIGTVWRTALGLGLMVATLLPLVVLLGADPPVDVRLTALNVVAGGAAVLTSYLLLVQASVTADVRLRWVAGGYGLLLGAVVARTLTVQGAAVDASRGLTALDRGAAVGLLWQLVLPVVVLSAGLARRSIWLWFVPAGGLLLSGVLVLTAAGSLPELVARDGSLRPGLQAAYAVLAVGAAVAAALWSRRTPSRSRGPWRLVLIGLVLLPVSAALRAFADTRYDAVWWTSAVVEAVALAAPAAGLLAQGSSGYFRQASRWYQLEEEVRRLRTRTALLPGRSITPEDEAGLPEEPEVRALVEQRRLKIALQPVLELTTGAIVGNEALSRFGGRTPTDRWFRAASRCGLGNELEEVTLAAALALLPTLDPAGFLAVNVSPAALTHPGVLALLHGCDLSRVVVEVTEHEAVADYPSARSALDQLRAEGASIAVDDTGAGFASLRHVLLLQPDIIKLDTSITRDVETDERQQALVRAILSFADEVGSLVLAEGVETELQKQALIQIGVPLGQGWHLGLPAIPGEENP